MGKAGMNHFGTVRLETKRLVLRRFREEDALPAFQNWESDEKVTEFLSHADVQRRARGSGRRISAKQKFRQAPTMLKLCKF